MKSTMLLLAAATFSVVPAAHAQETREPSPQIRVTGSGEASISPDMAVLTLTVMREAESAREALDANNEAMAEVTAAMREAGIEDRDLRTSGLQINPRYNHPRPDSEDSEPRIVAYQVYNTLTVRVRDIDIVGEVLDRSVTLGVNQGGSIEFMNDDPSEVMDTARRRAVEDAMNRARTLADAAGVSLGPVISIAEQTQGQPPRPMMARGMEMQMSDAAVPVEPGENTYNVHVNVTFGIEQNGADDELNGEE